MEIDMQQKFREKLGKETRPYVILGACLPAMAHEALEMEPAIGVLMPCNVCVWDNGDGTSTVSAINVESLFRLVDKPALAQAAKIIQAKLDAVMAWVKSDTLLMRAHSRAA